MGGDLREPSVGAAEERPVQSPPPQSNPSPSEIGAERWERAEEATQKIVCQVQPTAVSEERRWEVIDYVQRLMRGCLGCPVFPFGSVPLKTYLPDGDIDLTAFGCASVEDALVNDVVSVLEAEDKNRAAEFIVKDVQLIWAEVKLVKCIVQNIVVDISFNQLGGLCTLCFLEQVDRLIGKDHLFKRSIILIKAWCYYESRILGAHHGLISTYALETLVLYLFHLFHSTLNGPLAVLYRFLDYFSKFDWDNYCISLTGPVHISSLPEIVVEKPENGGSNLLLTNDFLRYYADMFSVPSRGVDINPRTFPQKHLNIIDPLKENNNLGRSVSKGNFFRIRSAFTYGARKLGQILLQPEDNIAGELCKFFSNTLGRHGSGQRPDVQDPVPMSGYNGFVPALSFSKKFSGNGKLGYNSDVKELEYSGLTVDGVSSGLLLVPDEGTGSFVDHGQDKNLSVSNHEVLTTVGSKDVDSVSNPVACSTEGFDPGYREKTSMGAAGSPEYLNSFPDLTGYYGSHLNSLQHGWCYEHSSVPAFPVHPPLPSQFQSKTSWESWDVIQHAYHFKRNGFSNVNANGFIPRPALYHMNTLPIPGTTFGVEEMPKPRGTGTYFPNANRPPYDRPLTGRGRNQGPVRSPRNNGGSVTPMEANLQDSSSRELSPHFSDRGNGKLGTSDFYESGSPGGKVCPDVNGLLLQSEGIIESGSVAHVPLEVPLPEISRQLNPAPLLTQTSTQSFPTPGMQKSKPVLGTNQERIMAKSSYHLKDEDDFPPLSI